MIPCVKCQAAEPSGRLMLCSPYDVGTKSGAPSDTLVVGTDAEGNELWSDVVGGVALKRGNAIVEDADGLLLVAGSTPSRSSGTTTST
jgi:hypothetical protein